MVFRLQIAKDATNRQKLSTTDINQFGIQIFLKTEKGVFKTIRHLCQEKA